MVSIAWFDNSVPVKSEDIRAFALRAFVEIGYCLPKEVARRWRDIERLLCRPEGVTAMLRLDWADMKERANLIADALAEATNCGTDEAKRNYIDYLAALIEALHFDLSSKTVVLPGTSAALWSLVEYVAQCGVGPAKCIPRGGCCLGHFEAALAQPQGRAKTLRIADVIRGHYGLKTWAQSFGLSDLGDRDFGPPPDRA